MKTLILDGSHTNDSQAVKLTNALRKHLPESETIVLREQRIGNCAGDFFCWVRSPGMCNTNDDNRLIAAKIVQSDLVIYLTPVTFGGYSSELKRMVDHQIQNISPFFTTVKGEIHHQKRYSQYPNVLTIGWMQESDPRAETIFRYLVHRNSINMHAKTSICGLVIGAPSAADLESQTGHWLNAIAHGSSSPVPTLPPMDIAIADESPVRRAVLLVGSPRTGKSTSSSLGGYLFEQLQARGIETQTLQIYTSFNSQTRMDALYEALDNADLVVLAFPVYVDTLPAPVTATLEKIAARRQGNSSKISLCCHFKLWLPGGASQPDGPGGLFRVCPTKRICLAGQPGSRRRGRTCAWHSTQRNGWPRHAAQTGARSSRGSLIKWTTSLTKRTGTVQ